MLFQIYNILHIYQHLAKLFTLYLVNHKLLQAKTNHRTNLRDSTYMRLKHWETLEIAQQLNQITYLKV